MSPRTMTTVSNLNDTTTASSPASVSVKTDAPDDCTSNTNTNTHTRTTNTPNINQSSTDTTSSSSTRTNNLRNTQSTSSSIYMSLDFENSIENHHDYNDDGNINANQTTNNNNNNNNPTINQPIQNFNAAKAEAMIRDLSLTTTTINNNNHNDHNDMNIQPKNALSRNQSHTSSVYFDSSEHQLQQQNDNYDDDDDDDDDDDENLNYCNILKKNNTSTNNNDHNENHDDHLLTIVQSSSDAPIVIFHPEQQSEIQVNSEMIQAQKMKQQQQQRQKEQEQQQNDSQHLLLLDDDDDDDNNDENNNNNTQYHEHDHEQQKSSSSLERLVQAASRPTFQTIQSCSKLMDDNTKVQLLLEQQNLSKMNTKDRIIHDIESKSNQQNMKRSAASSTSAATIKPRPSLAKHHSSISNHSSPSSFVSNSSSNSLSSMNSFASGNCSQRYKIKNSNTGQVYDIRDLKVVKSDDDQDIIEVKYTLFPSKIDLMAIHNNRRTTNNNDGLFLEGGIHDGTMSGVGGEGSGSANNPDTTNPFSPLKDTRMAISKSTNKAVNRIGKTLSKGFLRRSKSDGSAMNNMNAHAPFRPDQIGSLLEPFPNTIDENNSFTEIDGKEIKDDGISNSLKDDNIKMTSQVTPNENENTTTTTTTATAATIAQEQREKENIQSQESENTADTTDKSHLVVKKTTSARMRRSTKVPAIIIPKNTVPVKCINKSKASSDFNPLLLITTFTKAHNGPIWRCAFSKDGKYLATGGADGLVKIWEIAPMKERMKDNNNMEQSENDTNQGGNNIDDSTWKGVWGESESDDGCLNTVKSEADAIGLEIDFILPEPIQSFQEHTEDVIDMSWSDTGYLLTASFDKTVRLWHPTKSISLHNFKHADAVTSVSFHPKQDKYFLSGGFDGMIRIWDILSGRVVAVVETSYIITSATYQPDGKKVAAGTKDGRVIFYSVDGTRLKYFTEIVCKNRGKKYGKKVTGLAYKDLEFLSGDKDSKDKKQKKTKLKKAAKLVKNLANRRKKGKDQVLITSNDSRLRLVGMNDFCMIRKYKGHTNYDFMFKARFSESGEFIIIGSETGKVTIWNTATRRNPLNVNVTGMHMYDKVKSFECFNASTCNLPIVTEALFAPSRSAKNAFLRCGLFPSLTRLDHINHDFSSSIIVTSDYEGTIRVFLRRASFDTVVHASGPAGYSE